MDILLNLLGSWYSTIVTLVFFIAAYYAVKRLLANRTKGQTEKNIINSLILFSIIFIACFAVLLSLPMNPDQKEQIVGIIGIILSAVLGLSSTTFIGNALAGIALKLRDDFKPGDFVTVKDVFGRVTEMGLFHIEVQTADRNLTSMPNLDLVTSHVKVTRQSGTIVYAEVSLGYDVHHQVIEKSLLKAAKNAGLKDPFVHVISLGDFSVVYRINGLLESTKSLISSQSILMSAVLDALHEDGVEIVSPTFMNQRQVGDTVFIPKKMKRKTEEEQKQVDQNAIIFDKAEEAESIEKRKTLLAEVEAKIEREKEELKNCETDEQKAKVQKKLDTTVELRDKLLDKIDQRVEKFTETK